MEENEKNDFLHGDNLYISDGSDVGAGESDLGNDKEGEDQSYIDDESGLDNDLYLHDIDYQKLSASIRESNVVYQLDTDLNDLPVTDFCLLLVLLLLGLFIVGGKSR